MLPRDTDAAAAVSYDLIIIGGGIYGIMAALEAARRKLRPLLLERADFGGATSWNSLRIIHGGLRYLQSLDLHRFRESVPERRWFLRHFPDLVSPLECLMPLYGEGLRRTSILRAALRVNDLLSRQRNLAVRSANALPASRIIGPDETANRFPAVDRDGLKGGALWYDGVMTSSQRVVIESLRWATSYRARVLNYVEADSLLTNRSGAAAGIGAIDRVTGASMEFRAPSVLNLTGPWSRTLAARLDPRLGDRPELFQPSLAFNLFLDREPPAPLALAVRPRHSKSRTYFIHPWQGRTLAGTYHAPWSGPVDDVAPSDQQLDAFL
ncbi:MAG TPA: FAD-dependent oxidoreductase, partial [Armatimonadota bacterium]|nr:FAD-dependent oxidoreductase [Armatimonadota bacterium]